MIEKIHAPALVVTLIELEGDCSTKNFASYFAMCLDLRLLEKEVN